MKGNSIYLSEQDTQKLKEFQIDLLKKLLDDKLFNSDIININKFETRNAEQNIE